MSYIVKKGDTLSGIGEKLGINWREIASENNLHAPFTIYPNQVLKLPNKEAFIGNSYTVQKGDTLSGIGQKLGKDWQEIAKVNGLSSPYTIYPNQVLKLPTVQVEVKKEDGKMNISPFVSDAQKIQQQTGIPASIILGQIILEGSGHYKNGMSQLAYEGKNLFGMKGTGTAGSITFPTTEYIGGVRMTVNATFAKYNSFYDSIQAHAHLLSASRYAKYLKNAKSVNDYAVGIKAGGYATDPDYVNKLLNTISSNNLHQYDVGSIAFKPLTPSVSSGGSNSSNVSSGGASSISSKVGKVLQSPMLWGLLLAGLLVKP